MAWETPKTDWNTNPKSPMAVDFNRIEKNIEHLLGEIETKKGDIVTALNTMNQLATLEDSYSTLASKIKAISTDANATPLQVLDGKTFYQGGLKQTGEMPYVGTINHSLPINGSFWIPHGMHTGSGIVNQSIPTKGSQTYTPGTHTQTIASGRYLTGTQTILGDADLVGANIRKGKTLFGVEGQPTVCQTANGTATLTKYGTITTEEQIGQVARSLRFVVTGLPFKPSKVFVRGAFRARINNNNMDSPPYYQAKSVEFKYGIVSNALVEDRRYGTYFSAGGGMAYTYETYARITSSVTFQENGFTVTLTAQEPSSYPQLWEITDSGGLQYWFAQE